MLKIEMGNIIMAGASIALPENLYLIRYCSDPEIIRFTSFDKSISLVMEEVKGGLPGNIPMTKDAVVLKAVAPIGVNGLIGIHTFYKLDGKECYEAWLKNSLNEYNKCLRLEITAHSENIFELLARDTINEFLCSLRAQ